MILSEDEMKRACSIAVKEIQPRMERYKPDKPVIKNEHGYVYTQSYLGFFEDTLMFAIGLQWNYLIAGSVGRICQEVHVGLSIIKGDKQKRFLRLKEVHVPNWIQEHRCQQCNDKFNERYIIEGDTTLYEY